MTQIHFSICGLGLGHASRCRPLIFESLRRGFGITVSTYGDAVYFFKKLGLEVIEVPGLDYGRDAGGQVSIKATLLENVSLPMRFAAQTLIEARIIEESEADAVLSDTRASAIFASRLAKVPCTLLLNQYNILIQKDRSPALATFFEDIINSFTIAWSLADRLLVADYPPPLTISRENLRMRERDEKRAEYIGPILERLPEDYPPRERLKEELGFSPLEPLIAIMPTGPYPDRVRFRETVLRLLPQLENRQIVMTGVSTGGYSTMTSERLRLIEWYEDELELLAAADIVFTRAGQTLTSKALAFNCRLIITPIPRQTEQESNAKTLKENKVAIILHEKDLTGENLQAAINDTFREIDDTNLKRYSSFARQERAVGRVIDTVLKAKTV